LTQRLVFGQDNLLGFVAAACAQTRALAGRSIDAVKGSSTAATGDEAVTVLHAVVLATEMMNEVDSGKLAGSEGVQSHKARN
jgi:hypothetical protein